MLLIDARCLVCKVQPAHFWGALEAMAARIGFEARGATYVMCIGGRQICWLSCLLATYRHLHRGVGPCPFVWLNACVHLCVCMCAMWFGQFGFQRPPRSEQRCVFVIGAIPEAIPEAIPPRTHFFAIVIGWPF